MDRTPISEDNLALAVQAIPGQWYPAELVVRLALEVQEMRNLVRRLYRDLTPQAGGPEVTRDLQRVAARLGWGPPPDETP